VKKIGAKSTTGPEAIIIALIHLKTDRFDWSGSKFDDCIKEALSKHPGKFAAKSDVKLGQVFAELRPKAFKSLVDEFMVSVRKFPPCRNLMEQAVLAYSGGNKVHWAHGFIDRSFYSLVGRRIKQITEQA
jgi:hypothetical protein